MVGIWPLAQSRKESVMGNLILPVGWVLFGNGQLLGKHEVDGCVLTHKIPDKRVSDGHTTLVLSKEGQKVGLDEEVLLLSQAWKLGAALLRQECMFTSVTVMMHSRKGRSSGYSEPHAHIVLTKG